MAEAGGSSDGGAVRSRSPAANQKQMLVKQLRQQLKQMGQRTAASSTARAPSPPPARSNYTQRAQRSTPGRRAHALFYVRA